MTQGTFFLPITPDPDLETELFGVPRPDLAQRYSFIMVCKHKNVVPFRPDLNSTLRAPKSLKLKSFPEGQYEAFCLKFDLSEEGKKDFLDLLAEILTQGFEFVDEAEDTRKKYAITAGTGQRVLGQSTNLMDNTSISLSTIVPKDPTPNAPTLPDSSDPSTDEQKVDDTPTGELDEEHVVGAKHVEDKLDNNPKITVSDFLSLAITPYYLNAINGEHTETDFS